MYRNRRDDPVFLRVAEETGIPVSEVGKAVRSFFASIKNEARTLPLDNPKKIYRKEVFDTFAFARMIPFIGRIGPVYSRYLAWRRNESKLDVQVPRSRYRTRLLQDDIEHMAEDILAGKAPLPVCKKKGNELYKRVWVVGKDGKKLARQVIPKENTDVQD